jgi:hypothetical protein
MRGDAPGLDQIASGVVAQGLFDWLLSSKIAILERHSGAATARMRSVTIGAGPAEGSSRINRAGSAIAPCATAGICRPDVGFRPPYSETRRAVVKEAG